MEDKTKIKMATWNLCLGLTNKKTYVTEMIKMNEIDICCKQEVDIEASYKQNLLSCKGYTLVENNNWKSRSGILVRNRIKFHRRIELEGANSGLVLLDLNHECQYKIINVYRVFNPPGGQTQYQYFLNQLK